MIYSDLINNVQFEAYYDKDKRVLHVLDAMGMSLEPRKSVTNGIENLIPILEKQLKIKYDYKIFLYGTDGIISEFDNLTKQFNIVEQERPSVFEEFKEKMGILYTRNQEL